MRKQFLGSLIIVHLFPFFMLIMACLPLCGMEDITDGIHDIMIYHIIPSSGHHEQRMFAAVNKTYNKVIEDQYRADKKRIEQLMREKDTPIIRGRAFWNKDFSRCAWATIENNSGPKINKLLTLTLVGLVDNDIIVKHAEWSSYRFSTIEGTDRPFFNTSNDACFHGYGLITFVSEAKVQDDGKFFISCLEYSVSLDGHAKIQRCLMEARVGREIIADAFCLVGNLPVLLKAFLQSTKVREAQSTEHGDMVKLYNISGVTLPAHYKDFKRHPYFDYRERGAYSELAHEFRRAVDNRYSRQQWEKEEMGKKVRGLLDYLPQE